MSQGPEKKGCLVVSLSKNDKILINEDVEIEIKGRRSKDNISVKFLVRAPLSTKIKKVKKEIKTA